MIKKLFILSLIFLYSCSGYSPLFSKKINFKFNSIEFEGEKRLNQIIYRNIKNLENTNYDEINLIDVKMKTEKVRKIHSKDSKGNPDKYKMEIKSNLEIKFGDNKVYKKDFNVSEMYDDFDSQFEQNKYEKKTIRILTERLSEKIIIYLRTLE